MKRPRFTIQRAMILVAFVGVFVGIGVALENRRVRFGGLAAQHRLIREQASPPGGSEAYDPPFDRESENQRQQPFLAHHADMERKYRRGARCPWLPMEPDPPEPGW